MVISTAETRFRLQVGPPVRGQCREVVGAVPVEVGVAAGAVHQDVDRVGKRRDEPADLLWVGSVAHCGAHVRT
ncbi:MAG: hypothetical protein ACRDPW_09965 [Mycobacteriales bacterium]